MQLEEYHISANSTAYIFNATEYILPTEEHNIISCFITVRIPNFKRIKFEHSYVTLF